MLESEKEKPRTRSKPFYQVRTSNGAPGSRGKFFFVFSDMFRLKKMKLISALWTLFDFSLFCAISGLTSTASVRLHQWKHRLIISMVGFIASRIGWLHQLSTGGVYFLHYSLVLRIIPSLHLVRLTKSEVPSGAPANSTEFSGNYLLIDGHSKLSAYSRLVRLLNSIIKCHFNLFLSHPLLASSLSAKLI